jgi:hypothetical protein
MKGAYKRYYEKNREKITARMRELYAEKKAAEEVREKTEEELEVAREKMREKYYSRTYNKTRKILEGWLADTSFAEPFKVFIREYCLKDDKFKTFTPKVVETLYAVGSPVSALIV